MYFQFRVASMKTINNAFINSFQTYGNLVNVLRMVDSNVRALLGEFSVSGTCVSRTASPSAPAFDWFGTYKMVSLSYEKGPRQQLCPEKKTIGPFPFWSFSQRSCILYCSLYHPSLDHALEICFLWPLGLFQAWCCPEDCAPGFHGVVYPASLLGWARRTSISIETSRLLFDDCLESRRNGFHGDRYQKVHESLSRRIYRWK